MAGSVSPPIKGVGPLEYLVTKKLAEAIDALENQLTVNTDIALNEIVNRELKFLLAEIYREMVDTITIAKSTNSYKYGNYTYPDLSDDYYTKKIKRYGYDDEAPFKSEDFKKDRSVSVVGVLAKLSKDAQLGHKLAEAFGQFSKASYGFKAENYLSEVKNSKDLKYYQAQGERKKAELKRINARALAKRQLKVIT